MLYEILKQIDPYLFSIRKRDNIILIDLKIPTKWEFIGIVEKYETLALSVEDKNTTVTLIAVKTINEEEEIGHLMDCVTELIRYNHEKEEKEQLLKEKIKDLQNLFEYSDIEELKNLNFNGEQQREETNELVGEGSGEGQSGSGDTQEEDDRGDQES